MVLKTAVWNDLDPTQPLAVYDRGVDWPDAKEDRRVSYRIGDMVALLLKDRAQHQPVRILCSRTCAGRVRL